MAEPTYKVILSGETLPGHEIADTKKKLAAAFKLPSDAIDRYFIGRQVTVKSTADLKAAEKYRALFEKAGAVCSIKTMQQPEPEKLQEGAVTVPVAASSPGQTAAGPKPESAGHSAEGTAADAGKPGDESSGPRVISPPQKAVSLQFAPLPCRALSSVQGGLNFNRYGNENVPFANILLVSVYNLPAGIKPKIRIMVFIRTQKKPLTLDAESIDFAGILGREETDTYAALRQLIADLSNTNHSLIIDSSTSAFLQGSGPETIKRDEAFWASAIGAALDEEGVFVLSTANLKKPAKTVAAIEAEAAVSQDLKDMPLLGDEAYINLFVGPNADKYMSNFRKFGIKGPSSFAPTWHWPAFFVPFFWLLYRKLYLHALGVLVLSFIPGINLLTCVAMGLAAYYIYFKHARDSVIAIKHAATPASISNAISEEGGVKPPAVYVGIGGILCISIVISVSLVVSALRKKQELATEQMKAPVIMPLMPGQNLPPGFPQSPEQAIQMSYDNMAMAELKHACTAAMIYLNEERDGQVTIEKLERFGFRRRPEVQITILNSLPETLRMSARHSQGSKTIYADRDCRLE